MEPGAEVFCSLKPQALSLGSHRTNSESFLPISMETPDHLSFPELRSKFEKFPEFPPWTIGSHGEPICVPGGRPNLSGSGRGTGTQDLYNTP